MNRNLLIVGHLEVPSSVLEHRFYGEAAANALVLTRNHDVRKQVVGTSNTKRCELYGWMPNVDGHRDCTGYVYIVALNEGQTKLRAYATPNPKCKRVVTVDLDVGAIVRLNDFCLHWTEEKDYRVAAFVGSFDKPDDEAAIATLRAGIDALVRGDYYGAPRMRNGFRVLMPDECLVPNEAFDELEPALIVDAQRDERLIEMCGKCGAKPAVLGDKHWPYFSEASRCRDCLGSQEIDHAA